MPPPPSKLLFFEDLLLLCIYIGTHIPQKHFITQTYTSVVYIRRSWTDMCPFLNARVTANMRVMEFNSVIYFNWKRIVMGYIYYHYEMCTVFTSLYQLIYISGLGYTIHCCDTSKHFIPNRFVQLPQSSTLGSQK